MDCPKCGTWNPDDKRVCWRCQAEMPKPEEKKKRQRALLLGLPVWTWVVIAVMFLILFVGPYLVPLLSGGR